MDIRRLLFAYRGFLPVPLAMAILYFSDEGRWLAAGAILLAIGETVRLASVRHAGGDTRTRTVGAKRLCVSGPYRFVRNPLYLGNTAICAGLVMIAGGPWMVPFLFITLLFCLAEYLPIIALEEEVLRQKFGDEYERFCREVPQLLPRLTPSAIGSSPPPRSLAATLRTERRTLQLLGSFLLLLALRPYLPF